MTGRESPPDRGFAFAIAHARVGEEMALGWRMSARHDGGSGRFTRLRETAGEYAFMIDLAGIARQRRCGPRNSFTATFDTRIGSGA
jgi:protease II